MTFKVYHILLLCTTTQKRLDDDETAFVALQNVVEQACNHFLLHGTFPTCYEEMQAIPLLKVGLLTYAGDDGGSKGQSYRLAFDVQAGTASLRFRFPDEAGRWQWKQEPILLSLPACVLERLKAGEPMAPTLRELVKPDGSRVAVLDVIVQVKQTPLPDWTQVERVLGFDWGVNTLITAAIYQHNPADPEHPLQVSRPLFLNTGGLDGHQARTRRQIDQLKAVRDQLAVEDPRRAVYEEELRRCWRLYEARNHELAHLAANLLLLFAQVWGCSLICGERLSTLKSMGRGRGVRGRWRNWRNNTTIRAEIWHILRYKCHLLGMRFRSEPPDGTSHTCPHCVTPVKGHHFSGEQSSTSSGNGSMPNVSLAPERAVKDQSMTLRRESDGSSKPECLSGQSRHGESYTALILEPSGISGVWWEAGDTHYLLNTFFPTMGRYTQSGDVVPIREERFERETYIESI